MKKYSDKVYLDANFFIFSLLDRTEVGRDARKIYQKMVTGEINTVTSSLTFDEVMWVFIKAWSKTKRCISCCRYERKYNINDYFR